MDNTIVAKNYNGASSSTTADDIKGAEVNSSSANNLIGTGGSGGLTNGSNSNLVGVSNPGLGTFGANGGPTNTVFLLLDSPAINAGNAGYDEEKGLATDQRGYSRIVNGKVDIGAVQYQYDLGLSGYVDTPSGTVSGLATYTVRYFYSVTNNGPDPVNGATLTVPNVQAVVLQLPPDWTASYAGAGNTTIVFQDNNTLNTGDQAVFEIAVPVQNSGAGTDFTATATVGPDQGDANPQNNSVTLTVTNEQEGLPFDKVKLFHFTDTKSPNETANDFTASVGWGDGSGNISDDGSGTVSVVANPNGGFDVLGSHTYAEEGQHGAAVVITGADGTKYSNGNVLQSFKNLVLGNFPEGGIATVNWGDGSSNTEVDGTGTVSLVSDPVVGLELLGSHTYATLGVYTITVSYITPDYGELGRILTSTPSNNVEVTDPQQMFVTADAPLTAGALTPPPHATINQAISDAVLFHFTDADPNGTASDYKATVTWGDGTTNDSRDGTTTVSVVADPGGGFDVVGSHTYSQIVRSGTFKVQVSDAGGASAGASDSTFQALDPDRPLTAGNLYVPSVSREGDSISNQVLFHFTDADANAQASDYLVAVSWGDMLINSSNDGSGSVQVVADPNGGFNVVGSHAYLEGSFYFGVKVTDQGEPGVDTGGQVIGASSSTRFAIADPPVTATAGPTFTASENSPSAVQTVAAINDPGGPELSGIPAPYATIIQWGDGSLSVASQTAQLNYAQPNVTDSYVPVVNTPAVSNNGGSLTAGTYYYMVTSTTANGESAPSSEVWATTGDHGAVTLSWGQVAGAAGYKIYRGTLSGAEDTLIGAVASGDIVSFTDTGSETTSAASPPTTNTAAASPIQYVPVINSATVSNSGGSLAAGTYYYTVTSTTATSESPPSGEVSAAATDSASAVTLSWSQVAGAAGYKIYRGASPGAEDVLIAVISSGTTVSFTDTGSETTSAAPHQQLVRHQLISFEYVPGIVLNGDGKTFSVKLAHQYAEEGKYPVSVIVSHNGLLSQVDNTAVVSDRAVAVTAGPSFQATEGVASNAQNLATFTDPAGPESDANAYTATVTWGDGASSTATLANGGIVLGGDGKTFSVDMAHQYADEGTYSISIALNHEGASTPAVTTTATVADNDKLTATAGAALASIYGTPLTNATLATFTDTYAGNTASDFAANIDWGDGKSSVGTVSGSNGNFIVTGDHNYAEATAYTISVTINDDGAGTATATANTKATISPLAVTLDGTRVYDGTATAAASLLTVTNLVSGDDLTLTGAVALASPNVGDEAITSFSGLNLGGSSADNYTLMGATGSVMITQATTSFSNLTVQDIIVGTSTTTVSGDLTSDTIVPAGQSVSITLNGVTESATVGSDGHFEDDFNTAALQVGAYPISYSYGGDNNFTAASGTGALTVAYDVQLLFNNSKPVHSGAVLPIRLELTDASGADVSSPNIAVSAVQLVGPDGQTSPNSPGNSNPNGLFRYDPSLGGYIFNLSTKGLVAGTYTFYYTVGNDPTRHSLTFEVGDASKVKLSNANLSQTAAHAAQTPFASFIAAAFQDLLHRAPDDLGLTYWSQKLAAGLPPALFAQELTHSAEFYATNVIAPDYQTFLGRAADAAGLASWTSRMQHGLTDQQLEAEFIASPEFYAHAGGTNAAWVDAMYQAVLGRQADSGGRNYWTAQLAAGRSRLSVATSLTASQERKAQMIQDDYFTFLGRATGQAEVDYWVARFEHGATNEDIIGGLVGSSEYFKLRS